MVIEKCERMIQIIAAYNGSETEERTEIVFDRLEELILGNLQNLRSFYSGNCVRRFPNLKRLIFKNCPQMVSFCEGNISTPKVKKLILSIKEDGDEDEGYEDFYDELMKGDIDDRELHFDDEEFISYPMQQLVEGDINAATRKLWLNNQDVVKLENDCVGYFSTAESGIIQDLELNFCCSLRRSGRWTSKG
ncbi:hypothetical protein FEM48_Zijuj03G0021300 [Ziziphus jujuba var. spinosa]|uniref:Uncharacterized protein n=1 Tax=Ziziphus jujuba var. spinosa TaxID=714518 RepID=A0A978VMJ1_ZIZJJ|nr:hypothetical protein FEM48_Zijuj03G0021300 [Ziziphus jujuba var. spinosa]